MTLAVLLAALGGLCLVSVSQAQSVEDWSPDPFDYNRPERLDVREVIGGLQMSGLRQQQFVFKSTNGEDVPVLLTLPPVGDGPFPVVLLLHGFSSSKEGVTRQLARPLAVKGFACIAPDLPRHGARPGPPTAMLPADQPEEAYRNVVQAVVDTRLVIDLAETRRELATEGGVGLIGYSMGSWVGTLAGAADRRIKALVLMVPGSAVLTDTDPPVRSARGGETRPEDARQAGGEGIPERLDLVEQYPVLRHNAALPNFAPRPVLLQNGKRDVLVPFDRARALFEAAKGPKESRWYDSGHILPVQAYQQAADWLVRNMVR
jgi:pimeloyl-ACP methyl ester carboxylesterase